jgi:hypothetical protein
VSIFEIHGYAIVSDDDRIADAAGVMPDCLRNDADWRYFQAGLDQAALTVLGRLGHEANPNRRGRLRLVLSSQARGLEQRPDGWWWNPDDVPWDQAIATILPAGGRIAVPGGRRVFDLFLAIGYDAFHLARAQGTLLPGGVALFSVCDQGASAEDALARAGLKPGRIEILDADAPVSLSVWRR